MRKKIMFLIIALVITTVLAVGGVLYKRKYDQLNNSGLDQDVDYERAE